MGDDESQDFLGAGVGDNNQQKVYNEKNFIKERNIRKDEISQLQYYRESKGFPSAKH